LDIVEEARELAKEMTNKYGFPGSWSVETARLKALELADKLNADKQIVEVSSYLMDIGLGKAIKENKIPEHVKISSKITKEFLSKFDLSDEFKKKVINCVEAHHGEIEHICIESEIIKNADCFRFVNPEGFLRIFFDLGKFGKNIEEAFEWAKKKVEEKYNLVTLDICKEEAEENYKVIKEFLNRVNI